MTIGGEPTGDAARNAPSTDGASPGPALLRCPSRTRHYKAGTLLTEGFPVSDVPGLLTGDVDSVIWLDLCVPGRDDLAVVESTFGCHPLAVADAVEPDQRARVYQYRAHLYANLYVVTDPGTTAELGELSLFVTPRALVTVRKSDFEIDMFLDRWDSNRDLARSDRDLAVLIYSLLDAVVDGHSQTAQVLDDEVGRLEHAMLEGTAGTQIRRRAYEVDVGLADLRRAASPMTEIAPRFVRADAHFVEESLTPYYHDVIDHALHATETIDAARDRINRLVQTQLNEQSAQLNEITKKLAAWAAIIAVPAAVTSFYGQNVPYPGFSQQGGFIVSCVAIVVLAGAVYWLLRHNEWL